MNDMSSLPVVNHEPNCGDTIPQPGASGDQADSPRAREGAGSLRVAVADLEYIFRTGLIRALISDPGIELVSEIDQPGQLVSEPARVQPDIMFIQYEMLVPYGGALGAIRNASPATRLVVTASSLGSDEGVVALIEAGASGIILKGALPAMFIKCAHKVAEGEIWLPKKQMAAVARRLSEPATNSAIRFTAREKEVLSCVLQTGWRNEEIARRFSVTNQTIRNYFRSIYQKLGVKDRAELMNYATRHRLDLHLPRNEAIPKVSTQAGSTVHAQAVII